MSYVSAYWALDPEALEAASNAVGWAERRFSPAMRSTSEADSMRAP
jgi:hypothetical protein